MAGYIKIEAERVETTALNTQVNKKVFDEFRIRCKSQGYPMNVVLEAFMQQYKDGKFKIDHESIMKWKKNTDETETLNTTFNKNIYKKFKAECKENGYFIKNVVMAFMELYAKYNLVMGFVSEDTILFFEV